MLDREIGLIPGDVFGQPHFLDPRLAATPAERLNKVCRRADDVGDVAHQIAAAVVVVVEAVIEIVLRQELRLAKLAGP